MLYGIRTNIIYILVISMIPLSLGIQTSFLKYVIKPLHPSSQNHLIEFLQLNTCFYFCLLQNYYSLLQK